MASATNKAEVLRTRAEMQAWSEAARASGRTVALVPTMGAVHDGHVSLVRVASAHADSVVASLFVNPAQFAAGEDFAAYPRHFDNDVCALQDAGCTCVYCPDENQIYPSGGLCHVSVSDLSDRLDGAFRPHFFYGVTDAVCRLFVHVRPQCAVFGEKDYQQLVIVRRMSADLGFGVKIIAAPTVRDQHGLALSSRNACLTPADAGRAPRLYAALRRAAALIGAGEPVAAAVGAAETDIRAGGFPSVDYIAACDPVHLRPLPPGALLPGARGRLLVAATLGTTRLLDNVALERSSTDG